jgi:hypothetical protein
MLRIRDVLARPLDQRIEEIIKVDQSNEDAVFTEISEYVVTDRISREYFTLLKAIAEAPSDPDEGVGVWISGFFGSGKSSFAKNLGYVLMNRVIHGTPAAELFKRQVGDHRVRELVDAVNTRIPTDVVMFDVSVERAVRKATERIGEIMYTVLLRQLGYAEDFDLADLEIELEAEGRLAEFESRCRDRYSEGWERIRKGAQKIARASALLHELDPKTYPSEDSWARSIAGKAADITVGKFVDRAFELTHRRRPGQALVFIVDEVGQYVARSADKIEDLRAVVEEFGKESRNRVRRKQSVAPVWVVVTSQEKLDEVVAAIDSKRVELAKLQDRFKYRVDLAPADIREVATKRVLAKKPEHVPALEQLYAQHQGQLNAATRLERTSRTSEVRKEDFVEFYPYLPHFINLSIDIMSGIRLQPGAPRQLGGSNRTIIKQAYEMLVNERTALADKPLGTLVTLDRIYELVEGNLSSEKRKDISDIAERFKGNSADGGWAVRVARAIALLEFVRDLPRTPANLAAVLIDSVGAPKPEPSVGAALQRLKEAQFVRETEEGYKLQTAQEKNWETERRGYLEPKPKDRNDIKRKALQEIFAEPKVKTHRYKDLRSFSVGISVDGTRVADEGNITLAILAADDEDDRVAKLDQAHNESRQKSHENNVYWVFALTPEIDDLIANLYASRQMVAKYDQLRAQNRITNEELSSLSAEKQEALRIEGRLREKLEIALLAGTGIFRGVARDGSALGKTLPEVFGNLLDRAIPDLYPKLELGARPVKGTEAEEVLKAANLGALPQVLYGGPGGLNLIATEGGKAVPNQAAGVATEVLNYLKLEHSYGNKVTGRTLEDHFGGLGFGWDKDVLRLVLAVLLRAGAVEVTYQGRRFRSHQDPQCRVPFTSPPAFRASSFAPRETVDLRTLTSAVEHYESLTGGEVDVEEAAIATALKKLADDDMKLILPLEAKVQAHSLPVLQEVREFKTNLETIQAADTDDCVRILAGEGKSLKAARDRVRKIRQALADNGTGLATVQQGRLAVRQVWPMLKGQLDGSDGDSLASAAQSLAATLESSTFYEQLADIVKDTRTLLTAYHRRYEQIHDERTRAFVAAIDQVRGQSDWTLLTPETQETLIASLTSRGCETLELSDDGLVCTNCQATPAQMGSDLAALPGLRTQTLARLQELAAPEQKIERVRLADYFTAPLTSHESVEEALGRLRDQLFKLVDEMTRIVLE